jgi:hypothetical protein
METMNQRVKKLSFFDVQLIKAANIFLALIIVKLIPQILNVDIGWFVMLCILCIIKPFYVAWIKDD